MQIMAFRQHALPHLGSERAAGWLLEVIYPDENRDKIGSMSPKEATRCQALTFATLMGCIFTTQTGVKIEFPYLQDLLI